MIAALFLATVLQAPAAQDASTLTLSQAVDHALASHPTVAVARAQRDRALADLGDAHSARRPRVTLDASFTQFQEPMVVLPLHGFDPRFPPLFDRSLVQSGVSVGWTVYDFGQRAARIHAQDALGDAADAGLSTAQRQIVARTAAAYIRVLTARGVLSAHDQRIAALTAAGSRVRQLVAEGKAARLEQLRVDAATKSAEADRIASASQLAVAESELAQLTQLPAATIQRAAFPALQLTDAAYATDTSASLRAELVARAFTSSSELAELDGRSRAASAGSAAARTLRYPEIRANGAFVDRGRLAGDFAGEWQLGLGLSYPLYTGGTREHSIARAAADEHTASAQIRIAQLNIETGIDRTLASLREAHARAAALQSAVDQSAEVARIEQLSLDVGSGTQTDFLDAQATLLRARASLVEAQNAALSARVELARVIGELSREWLARTMGSGQ